MELLYLSYMYWLVTWAYAGTVSLESAIEIGLQTQSVRIGAESKQFTLIDDPIDDPEASFENNGHGWELRLDVPIPWSGDPLWRAREKSARKLLSQAYHRRAALELAVTIGEAYLATLKAEELLAIMASNREYSDRSTRAAVALETAGEIGTVDRVVLAGTSMRMSMDVDDAEAETRAARATLAALTGISDEPLEWPTWIAIPKPKAVLSIDHAAATARVAHAQYRRELADSFPKLAATVGADLDQDIHPVWGLSIQLPLFSLGGSAAQRTRLEALQADFAVDTAKREWDAEIIIWKAEYEAMANDFELNDATVQQALTDLLAAFTSGELGLFEFTTRRDELIETRTLLLERRWRRTRALLHLHALAGTLEIAL